MFTEVDERKGLVRTYWQDIRSRILAVEPSFAKLVDELNPDHTFPLYIAYYPYGSMDADTESTLYPDLKGGFFRLTDSNVPPEVLNDLGYSKRNTPLGMVLEKQIECFIDLKNRNVTIPFRTYTPGKCFPATRMLNSENKKVYAPYKLLCSTAGARSVFMLPNIGCIMNHAILQRDYKIKSSAPKSLYNHWQVFKELISSEAIKSDWCCCVLYFSEKWMNKLNTDKRWVNLKGYLAQQVWDQCEYEMNRVHYDMIFSIIQQNKNLKPNPYLSDTAKHLFSIACGAVPGYAPADDEDALPVKTLERIFIESYGLKKYIPTIMKPEHYNFETSKQPVYYSLQNPSTLVFSPKSRVLTSTLSELRELEHIVQTFLLSLASDTGMCASNTIINQVAKTVKFNYFHNKLDSHGVVQPSAVIADLDHRFRGNAKLNDLNASFACDGPFVRGCVRMSI